MRDDARCSVYLGRADDNASGYSHVTQTFPMVQALPSFCMELCTYCCVRRNVQDAKVDHLRRQSPRLSFAKCKDLDMQSNAPIPARPIHACRTPSADNSIFEPQGPPLEHYLVIIPSQSATISVIILHNSQPTSPLPNMSINNRKAKE